MLLVMPLCAQTMTRINDEGLILGEIYLLKDKRRGKLGRPGLHRMDS